MTEADIEQELSHKSPSPEPEPCHYSSRKSTPDPQLVQDPVDDYIPVSGIRPTDAMYVFLMNFFLALPGPSTLTEADIEQELSHKSPSPEPEPCHDSSRKSTPDPQLVQDPVDDYIPVSGIGPTDAMYVFLMNFFLALPGPSTLTEADIEQELSHKSPSPEPEPAHDSSRKSTPDPQLVQDPVDDYIPVSGIGPTDAMYVFLMNFFL